MIATLFAGGSVMFLILALVLFVLGCLANLSVGYAQLDAGLESIDQLFGWILVRSPYVLMNRGRSYHLSLRLVAAAVVSAGVSAVLVVLAVALAAVPWPGPR